MVEPHVATATAGGMLDIAWNDTMLVSGIILFLTFVGIFTERVHGFDRAKFAMLGAGAMVGVGQVMGFYNPDLALQAIDWNVVFLLGCMMTIVSIMIPTGGFQALAWHIADWSGGRQYLLLIMLGTAVTVISLLLDNVTTVVIFGPLIILIAQTLKVNPIPYLLAAALLSDTGGVATLVGDPPNLMIGSAANINFNDFLVHMAWPTFVAWVLVLGALRLLFWHELSVVPAKVEFAEKERVRDAKTWHAALAVLAGMVVLFIVHDRLGWEPWVVSAAGLMVLVFVAHHIELDAAFEQVEIPLLLFFVSLFIVVGGVEHSQFLMYLGQHITPFVERDLWLATIVLLWVAAILSAMIDNIPFTAAMIPIIAAMEAQGINVTPLWWALAAGVGMGGNGTHIGSTANVFIVTISERLARERGDPSLAITPGLWFRKGTPAMILTLIACTVIFTVFFEYYSVHWTLK